MDFIKLYPLQVCAVLCTKNSRVNGWGGLSKNVKKYPKLAVMHNICHLWNGQTVRLWMIFIISQVRNPRGGRPLDPRFWGPKIQHFWALFHFSIIFFASLHSAYYFFNILLFHSSNSKIFQPCFAWHMISHLDIFILVLVSHILGY